MVVRRGLLRGRVRLWIMTMSWMWSLEELGQRMAVSTREAGPWEHHWLCQDWRWAGVEDSGGELGTEL